MFVIIGIVIVLGAVIGGFFMHHGNPMGVVQKKKNIILRRAAFCSFFSAHRMANMKASIKAVTGLFKPDPYTKPAYNDLLKMMYQLFNVARKEGLLGLEKHIEDPAQSEIVKQYPTFLANHHACSFLCDTMKVIL